MIDWLASNWIALVALVVSTGLALLRISEWWNARHRVYVVCRSMTVAVPAEDGERTSNRSCVAVTVTTEGRPVAINAIRFEIVGEAPDPSQGPTMGSVDSLIAPSTSGFPPTGFGDPVNLTSGAGQTWTISLDVPPYGYTTVNGYMFRGTVELTNGKSFKSDTFWHVPSPPDGWSEEDLAKAFGV